MHRTIAERGPLLADALTLLNGIDLKSSVQKDVKKSEAQKLLALTEAIDSVRARFAEDEPSRWPTNETVAMLFLEFTEISPNNSQHHLARDVMKAMRDGGLGSLCSTLKLLTYVPLGPVCCQTLRASVRTQRLPNVSENVLKRWNYDPQSDGFASFEVMTVAEAGWTRAER